MNMIDAVKICFSKYVTFSGRARRAEYWWFALFCLIVNLVLTVVDMMVLNADLGLLANIWSLAVFLPSIAVSARRLHDINRSGWWQLIVLVPIVGLIVLIVFFAKPGDKGANRFGNDPMTGDRSAVFT